jgi:ElaB/YqjD/DUF883 family membrane-anchored ribosome-binding protein
MEPMQTEKIPSNVEEIPGRGETFTAARERFNEAAQYADQQVRANPWIALGVGFGAGIVIGALAAFAAIPRRRWY